MGLIIPLALFLDAFEGSFGLLYSTRAIIVTALAVSLVVLAILEFFRFRFEGFSKFFWMIFGPLMKEGEREYMNATVPYFTANLIVILFFPAELAVLSLAFLVIGDPFAAYIGSNYGKHRLYNGKSIEGIIAFIISASLFGLGLIYLFSFYSPGTAYSLLDDGGGVQVSAIAILMIGTIVAGITEFFSGTTWKGFLDDNLLIPIVSCFVMAMSAILIFGIESNSVFFPISEIFTSR
ncbi:MAG: dolichol kinase [Leptospira sp.]|nr:dolichol kinase [Leptospira sp.]